LENNQKTSGRIRKSKDQDYFFLAAFFFAGAAAFFAAAFFFAIFLSSFQETKCDSLDHWRTGLNSTGFENHTNRIHSTCQP